MKILTVTPMQEELDFCVQGCVEQGFSTESIQVGLIPTIHLPELGLVLAPGGLGKAQFAVQTQHLIERGPEWDVVICAGAAGGLSENLAVGDVVIGSETIEFDIHNNFGEPLLPRFKSSEIHVEELKQTPITHQSFNVYVGLIASGDEDVVDDERRRDLRERTEALANGWEGAGGARACHFSGIPFVEVRGISDGANATAAQDFEKNLPLTMKNIATLLTTWAQSRT
ncbi:5'-methylthioadenosine/S-adenosylhomocysteine nucleosidase [Chloroflexi bacterium TSY]|nr:5'-methylthioadenosine/S-adenosylhomocysteine nucleosidase [Chloroflexi bacterium TSY]